MIPLKGVHDIVDLTLIVNPWQAIVACVVIFAVLIWPQMSARQTIKKVEKTLTTNNGGSTVKDQMDRIEKVQAEQGAKLDDHVKWSEDYVRDTGDRLTKLETPKKRRLLSRR